MRDTDGSDKSWLQTARLAELGLRSASLLHELRQPLFAIKAQAQLGRAADDGSADRWAAVLDQVDHIEALLRQYGDMQPVAGAAQLFDLNAPVQQAIDICSAYTRRSGVAIEVSLSPEALVVCGREVAARQIAVNLLQNACDAAADSADRHVVVRTGQLGDVVRLAVEDSGPGIPAALRPQVFQPFMTTKPPGKGTGLGLYIVRRLIDESQGALRIMDSAYGGARFEVDWPRASVESGSGGVGDLGFR